MLPASSGLAGLQAAGQRPTLTELLARYPQLNAPQLSNVATQHMQAMAKRANTSSRSQLLLRSFLAGQ